MYRCICFDNMYFSGQVQANIFQLNVVGTSSVCLCVCVCVCVCVRACVRACMSDGDVCVRARVYMCRCERACA